MSNSLLWMLPIFMKARAVMGFDIPDFDPTDSFCFCLCNHFDNWHDTNQKKTTLNHSLSLFGNKVYNLQSSETNLHICFWASYWVVVYSGMNPVMIRFKRRKSRFMINRLSDKDYTIYQM